MATKLSPVGSQFRVNQIVANDQSFPDIAALSDGRFAVVYRSSVDAGGTNTDICGQFVNANGTLSGSSIVIANPGGIQQDPAVAARSSGFTTVWQDWGTTTGTPTLDPDIYYAVTSAAGTNTVNRTVILNSTGFKMQNPDIATLSDFRQIVVAELVFNASEHDIEFDVLGADGTTQKFSGNNFGTVENSSGLQQNPQVAAGPNGAVVVYEDNRFEAAANAFHISMRVFDGTTETFGSVSSLTNIDGHSVRNPDVAYIGGGRYAIVYERDAQGIFARIIYDYGGPIGGEIAVSTAAAAGVLLPKVTGTPDGGFVVTWTDINGPAPDTDGSSVHARRFDPYGNPFGDDFVVNSLTDNLQLGPVIATSGGNVMTAWQDYASRPGDTSPPGLQAQAFSTPGFDYDSASFGDFESTGRSGLLFQATGFAVIWTTNAAGTHEDSGFGTTPSGFGIDGTGNFNSTPGDDILLRNTGTGQVAVWVTNGTSIVDFKVLGSAPAAYLNAGNGDFTGDGQSDLLFRHSATGEIASWQVVDNALAAPAKVLGSAPTVYQIVAVADFTGDHQADILFRNIGTGEIAEWQVANNQLLSAQVVGSTSPLYHVVGTGDFDGNGANDILFRHDNGELVMWLLNSAGQLLSAPISVATVSTIYHVEGTGDLNGDGRSDIIFRDPSGNVIEWLMNGASAQAMQNVDGSGLPVPPGFSIAAHHFDLI
jgi:hypothetical protein